MKYPSITDILRETQDEQSKKSLEKWKLKVGVEEAEKIATKSKERGIIYDSYVDSFFKGISTPHKQLNEFLSHFKLHSLEKLVTSNEHKYCGRYDCILQYENYLIINDFKGSEKPKSKAYLYDYPLQISAYWQALKESGINCNMGMITVILPNEIQTFKYSEEELKYYFNIFKFRLLEYYIKNPN
jgi:genome maintenance exonuclease 1